MSKFFFENDIIFFTFRNISFEYEDEKLKKRQELLEEVYTERFGTKEERETVRFYSVSEEKNLDTTFIADLYKENGVELK
ncbi:hypothetical protein OIM_03932 [Enterococcus faecium EnGen0032]|nr:hypothetical protein OIM_03932 [Enterococcus faecium EnGen0032]